MENDGNNEYTEVDTQDSKKEGEEKIDYEGSIKNLKHEFNRKIDNLTESNQQLINLISSLGEQAQPTSSKSDSSSKDDEDLETLMYTDPKKALAKIKKEIEGEIMGELDSRNKVSQEQQNVITQLVNEYPELSDSNHELTKKTMEVYSSLSDKDRSSPLAYKVAARDAAAELGIVPKSRRKGLEDSESFSLGSHTGGASKGKSKGKVHNATLAFAEALGYDANDRKLQERLAKYSNRKFNKWG